MDTDLVVTLAPKWEGQQESLGVPAGDVWPSLNKGVPTA